MNHNNQDLFEKLHFDGFVLFPIDKNNELVEALRIKLLPTLMIYKCGEMVWRQSGEQDANTLIELIKEFS